MTDWPVKTLGSICEVFDDGDWIESKDQAPTGVRLVQTGNVGEGVFKDRSDKARFISEATFTRLRCTEIIPGDLLVSRLPDPVGRACLIPDTGSKMITAVDCTIMRPRKAVMSPQFLVAATQTGSYREQVRAKITGTTRDRISRSNLAEVQVPVPPLEEQKRIVALLDAATASITELTACYEQARTHANNLFTSALRDALEGNPDWPVKTLGEVCEDVQRLDPAKSKSKVFTYIDLSSIDQKKKIVSGAREILVTEAPGRARQLVRGNDVLVSTVRPNLNAVALVEEALDGATASTGFCVLRPMQEEIDSRLVFAWIRSQRFIDELSSMARGTSYPAVTDTVVKSLGIPVPPLEEQKRIVDRLDEMRAKTSEMVAAYDAKLTAVKNLRQSILESAFAGEL